MRVLPHRARTALRREIGRRLRSGSKGGNV